MENNRIMEKDSDRPAGCGDDARSRIDTLMQENAALKSALKQAQDANLFVQHVP